MTKDQVTYIVQTLLGDQMDAITYLPNAKSVHICTFEKKWCDKNYNRFYFNSANELLECIKVRKYSEDGSVPSSGKYDVIRDENGKNIVYQYLTDKDDNILKDIYSFDSITLFEFNIE